MNRSDGYPDDPDGYPNDSDGRASRSDGEPPACSVKTMMMQPNTYTMPALMQQLHALPFDYLRGNGIDFEPYDEFLSVEDTREWFRAWTGNSEADGSPYLVFGQDGTGGYAAFWLVREGRNLLAQPIVFLGSEGEMGVVAQNFSDYLWLLAAGFGPFEAVEHPGDERVSNTSFADFAQEHATTLRRTPSEIAASAAVEFPDFEKHILSMCR